VIDDHPLSIVITPAQMGGPPLVESTSNTPSPNLQQPRRRKVPREVEDQDWRFVALCDRGRPERAAVGSLMIRRHFEPAIFAGRPWWPDAGSR